MLFHPWSLLTLLPRSYQSDPESDGDGNQDSNSFYGLSYETLGTAAGAFVIGAMAGKVTGTLISAEKTIRFHNQVKKASLRRSIKKVQDKKAENEKRRVAEEDTASRRSALAGISVTVGEPTIGE